MIWTAGICALGVHVTILGTVHALGLSMVGEGFHAASATAKHTAADDDVEIKASCFGDAVFATSGRTAMCFAPWIGDVDQCLADAQMNLWMDLSSCEAQRDPHTAVAVIEQKTADRLKPIDPERLLDEVKREPKAKPPVPPPPQIAQAEPPPPPPPAPPPPPPQTRPQQIIETVKPSEEEEPENARFLAEFNTKAEKETVSRGARNEPMVAKAKPEELTPKDRPKDEPSVKQQAPDRMVGKNERAPDVPGHLSMRNPGAQSPAETEQEAKVRGSMTGAIGSLMADGYLSRKGDSAISQERHERSEIPRGQNGAGGGAPQVPNLNPSQEVLERLAGGGSVDHLENVQNGQETALSAKRWVYASFFNRLKRQVAMNWDPGTVWRRRDPTGTVFGFKTRITEVRVSLSRSGALEKILVTMPSGVTELDEEAVRAFRSAGPFPNPPEGLVQQDNLITFPFAFYFEIGGRESHLQWRLPQAM